MPEDYDPKTQLALIKQDVSFIRSTLEKNYFSKTQGDILDDRLRRIEKIVYTFMGVLALAVVYGLINLIPGLNNG